MYDRFPDKERQLHEATSREWIRKYELHQQLADLDLTIMMMTLL